MIKSHSIKSDKNNSDDYDGDDYEDDDDDNDDIMIVENSDNGGRGDDDDDDDDDDDSDDHDGGNNSNDDDDDNDKYDFYDDDDDDDDDEDDDDDDDNHNADNDNDNIILALKCLSDSRDISNEFLNEIKAYSINSVYDRDNILKSGSRDYEIEKQFNEAEEYRRKNLSSIKDSQSLTTHPQAIYKSRLLNPFVEELPKDDIDKYKISDVMDVDFCSLIEEN
ncbi:unnamed protein product [Rhizophagus irregularis]|nr:unnamed protein product [Rhizophagus irregularis]